MDDSIRLPISILVSAGTGIAAFAGAWAAFRGRLQSLEKRVDKIEASTDKQAELLNDAKIEVREAARRISDISELKETAVTRDLFAIRMSAQDDILNELRIALDRKVSISQMAAAKDSRREHEETPPPPPQRPRLPSRPR